MKRRNVSTSAPGTAGTAGTAASNLPAQQQQGGGAIALPAELVGLGDFQRPANLAPADEGGKQYAPYLMFYSGKGKNVAPIAQQLGQKGLGTPILCVGGDTFYDMSGAGLIVVKELPYWAACDDQYMEIAAWSVPQPRGKQVQGQYVSEVILAVCLHLPGTAPLHADLAPAVVSVSRFRSATARAVRGHLDGVERAMTPEWAREGGNGALVKFPPRFRVVSTLTYGPQTAKSGRTYIEADAHPAPISLGQLQAFGEWTQDQERQAELVAAVQEFDAKAAEITALIEDTRKKGL